jgi:hypothetical protein
MSIETRLPMSAIEIIDQKVESLRRIREFTDCIPNADLRDALEGAIYHLENLIADFRLIKTSCHGTQHNDRCDICNAEVYLQNLKRSADISRGEGQK